MLECVRLLIEHGSPADARDSQGRAPLHQLCTTTSAELVECVIAGGADANARDKEQRTPLHVAVECMAIDAVEALLKAGADPKAASSNGVTPISVANKGVEDGDEFDDDAQPEDDDSPLPPRL